MKHTVITISRQHGSGGREVGRQLSERLGIPFYDHELIEMAAKSSSIDKSFFENADGKGAGGFLDELAAGVHHDLSLSDKAFLHQSSVIREIASKGGCIIVGRCADYVLRDRANVLKVFVYADLDSRKERIEHIYKEEDEKALSSIEKTDKKRASYYKFYTGQNFGEAKNYDICLNSSLLGIEKCVEVVQSVYLKQESR
ncbi:cytidylate kinase-like family protein [Clostridium sp. M62/1]|nr:cytidylate kinase-like family protein [Clostridium sp. M62/1]UEB80458.1 cytidylate kinase-like family protein [Clostridium sp. M62/1]